MILLHSSIQILDFPSSKKKNNAYIEEVDRLAFANPVQEATYQEAAFPVESESEVPASEETGDNASMLFEQRQRQYLKGRYATRSIVDNMGNVIIDEGMQIDDAVIDEAKSKGKLIELVMNNRA